mgnify:CR=1 FL=1
MDIRVWRVWSAALPLCTGYGTWCLRWACVGDSLVFRGRPPRLYDGFILFAAKSRFCEMRFPGAISRPFSAERDLRFC